MKRSKLEPDHAEGGSLYFPRAIETLSHPALVLLMDLAGECVRVRNGNMLASYQHMRARSPSCWRSSSTHWKALRECVNRGFVAKTSAKPGRPHTYRLTFFGLGLPSSPSESMWPIHGWRPTCGATDKGVSHG